jgi:hypothetical protein
MVQWAYRHADWQQRYDTLRRDACPAAAR